MRALKVAGLLCLLFVVACGGGGGGGGDTPPATEYTGSVEQAAITNSNAVEVAYNSYDMADTAGHISPASVSSTGSAPPAMGLAKVLKGAVSGLDFGSLRAEALQPMNETIYGNCAEQGQGDISTTFDDVTGAFTGSIVFTNFCNQDVTINGGVSISGVIDPVTEEPTSLTITFAALTVASPSESFTVGGTVSFDDNTNTASMNVVFRDNVSGKTFWVRDYSITSVETVSYEEISLSGTFYHSDYGSVSISVTALRTNTGDRYPSSGTIVVTGLNGSKARLTALTSTTFMVEADQDGNGIYEWNSETLYWGGV